MQNLKNGSLVVLVIVLRSSVEWILVSVDNAPRRLHLLLCVVYPQYGAGRHQIPSSASFQALVYTINFGLVMWLGFE